MFHILYVPSHVFSTAGSDYIATSDTFTFNDFSLQMFCLDIGINDDQLVEITETFLVCAKSDPNVRFTTDCASVNINDNDGMECTVNSTQLVIHFSISSQLVAEFRFTQSSYNVSEDGGVVSVCLELVNGTLAGDVLIEVTITAIEEEMAGCRSLETSIVLILCIHMSCI